MQTLSPELTRRLTVAIEKMPAFPKSVQSILDLTRDPNCTPKDLVQIIEKDPVVTLKILKVVNAAQFNLPKQVTSINHAVVLLGFNTIKHLALGIAAMGVLPRHTAAGLDMQQYLLHSLTTACLARELANHMKHPEADPLECFIAGLLHDFGKVVYAQHMPDEFRLALETSKQLHIPLHEALRQTVGADHTVTGALLLEHWRFAWRLVETIQNMHGPQVKDTPMIACVFAANQISKKLQLGFAGNLYVEPLTEAMRERLGGDLDTVINQLGNIKPFVDEARLFTRLET
ncbi:HDOD domain-containing protein [Hylemonella gracilis]|uniref:HDOD domain-containing protein n=1 Tax=Hylemonella gracilis TaxID=80880 RepID=A0A4P6ULR9_9BURK|nr:HDOD domain-containing protein [Hylemonella gracilis]QBK05130.1 HDOD domain-containing protein [Hylemonella gracilis]